MAYPPTILQQQHVAKTHLVRVRVRFRSGKRVKVRVKLGLG